MKKVKIMLMSIALLAITAGVWAFNTKGSAKYCTAPTNSSGNCNDVKCASSPVITGTVSGSTICYLLTDPGATSCPTDAGSCPNIASKGEQ